MDKVSRLEHLRKEHRKIHEVIEALEGEKAPEETIIHQKKIKLSIKDEIAQIENELKTEGVIV
jgi:hypothetical protein